MAGSQTGTWLSMCEGLGLIPSTARNKTETKTKAELLGPVCFFKGRSCEAVKHIQLLRSEFQRGAA